MLPGFFLKHLFYTIADGETGLFLQTRILKFVFNNIWGKGIYVLLLPEIATYVRLMFQPEEHVTNVFSFSEALKRLIASSQSTLSSGSPPLNNQVHEYKTTFCLKSSSPVFTSGFCPGNPTLPYPTASGCRGMSNYLCLL